MTLRLQITPPDGVSRLFEHPGPSVHLGRDPTSELALEHPAVSWRHARIDLGPEGAWITDLGSSNGTYLDGLRLTSRAALTVGAQIGLGQGGPRLSVLALPHRAARSEGPRQAQTSPLPIDPPPLFDKVALGAVAVLGILLLLLGMVTWGQSARLASLSTRVEALESQRDELTRKVEALEARPVPPSTVSGAALEKLLAEVRDAIRAKEKPLPPPPPLTPTDKDGAKEKPPEKAGPASGRRGVLGKVGPALGKYPLFLAARPANGGDWRLLDAGAPLTSGDVLMTPMLCRASAELDTGARLALWGDADAPADRPHLRVYDSRLTLHDPEKGFDADFTLGRGRVVVRGKAAGVTQVRIRFRDYVWDITLPEGAALALDLRRAARTTPGKVPLARLMVLFRGKGVKVAEHREYPGYPNEDDFWVAPVPEASSQLAWPALSSIWDGKLEDPAPEVAAALARFHKEVKGGRGGVSEALARMAREEKDEALHAFAVLALAAADDVGPLAAALGDPDRPRGRLAALTALRYWAGQAKGHPASVRGAMIEAGADEAGAALVESITRPQPREEAEVPQRLDEVLAGLSSRHLAVRQAAAAWLAELFPEGAKIGFDPAAGEKAREAAVKKWRELARPPGG
jgi:outer membrane murein-binding lipoprotein Lpp